MSLAAGAWCWRGIPTLRRAGSTLSSTTGATPDNFLNVVHDALIKNFREQLYDHLALAEHYEFAEGAKSASFRLRPGLKFHNGAPITPEDVKWSYQHYHGAWAKVLQDKTDGVEVAGDDTVRFHFK